MTGALSLITLIRAGILIVCLPLACGAFLAARTGRRRKGEMLVGAYVYGWIVLFALFEIICVPFVILLGKFAVVSRLYTVLICVAAVCSVTAAVFVCKKGKTAMKTGCEKNEPLTGEKKPLWWSRLLWILVLLLGAMQVGYMFFYYYLNGDDAYYVAQSVMTDYFDTMFVRDAYTGYPNGLDVRHALAALPVFITWLARGCGVHVATAAHTILPPALFLLLCGIYTLIGWALFSEDRRYAPLFVLIAQVWYMWGNVSLYTPETFFYTRTWQGKAIFANMIIPLVLYLIYQLISQYSLIYAALLALTCAAGVLMTAAAVYLLLALCGIAALYCLILEKNRRKCIGMLLCCIPTLIYGGIYLYLLKIK